MRYSPMLAPLLLNAPSPAQAEPGLPKSGAEAAVAGSGSVAAAGAASTGTVPAGVTT